MEFMVKLIEVNGTKDQEARDDLNKNCTHVAKNYWLFEGNTEFLDTGIDFDIAGEEAIESFGDLSGSDIIEMVSETYNVDRCFL